MASVTLENVRKVYAGGVEAVKGVSLDIPDGSFTVLLGPSGCGKSTLLRMIAGLETITARHHQHRRQGRQRGRARRPRHRHGVPELRALSAHERLRQHGLRPAQPRHRPSPRSSGAWPRPPSCSASTRFLKRKPRELSGGQRQRVAMGRAIVREPQAFLFDEPLSNLDAKLRVQMRVEIRRLHNRLKATSIFVTHDQVEAMTLADMVVVMNGGRIEQIGAPTEVYRLPATRFVATFIGSPAMNLVPGKRRRPGHRRDRRRPHRLRRRCLRRRRRPRGRGRHPARRTCASAPAATARWPSPRTSSRSWAPPACSTAPRATRRWWSPSPPPRPTRPARASPPIAGAVHLFDPATGNSLRR